MKSSSEWESLLNNLGDKPEYTSKYQSSIDGLLDKITNREQFSYDFNADPLYQQYKDQYTKLGNEASMNAAANASALSGGYGNSYAATAATQANQQYLTQLNNVIPELANAALQKYQMETENLYNQYSVLGDAEDRSYGQYRDTVSDYYTNRDYYTSGYQDARNYEYQQERDAIADAQWNKTFQYQQDRDAVSDDQWNKTFQYQQDRDAVSDTQWDKTFQYQQDRDLVSDDQWNKTFQYQQNRDAVSDAQWEKTFQYQQDRDAVSDAQWEKNYNLSSSNAESSNNLAAAKFEFEKQKYADEQSKAAQTAAAENFDVDANEETNQQKMILYNYVAQNKRERSAEDAKDYIQKLFDNHQISWSQAERLLASAGL